MNKKGMMMGMGAGRQIFSGVLGLIFLALGGIPLLNELKVISFNLPTVPMIIFWVLALVGAVLLIVDGFKEEQMGFGARKIIGIISFVIALILIVYGLGSFGILPFTLPAFSIIIIDIIFALAGLFLIIGAFVQF
jgi:hypothetical protein